MNKRGNNVNVNMKYATLKKNLKSEQKVLNFFSLV